MTSVIKKKLLLNNTQEEEHVISPVHLQGALLTHNGGGLEAGVLSHHHSTGANDTPFCRPTKVKVRVREGGVARQSLI